MKIYNSIKKEVKFYYLSFIDIKIDVNSGFSLKLLCVDYSVYFKLNHTGHYYSKSIFSLSFSKSHFIFDFIYITILKKNYIIS